MIQTPYTHITVEEAFERNLHHGGVEERTDTDGVVRAYHQATQTYWDVPVEPESATAHALRLVREEWTRPYRLALEAIRDADPVEMALDPGWAARQARAALEASS